MTIASESCLQNPIIIQKILKRLSPKPMENLNLRLINKSFSSEMLHRIRLSHRNIQIKLPKAKDFHIFPEANASETVLSQDCYVNEHTVKTEQIVNYLEFLTKIVNVKVEHFERKNFWAPVVGEECRKGLHNEIHKLLESQPLKTFIGMSDLCDGFCSKCYLLAAASSHYGPLQTGISVDLSKNNTHVHFQKLIVEEKYLHGIASNISMYLPVEDPKKFIDYYVDPLISCNQLCFKISGFRGSFQPSRLPTVPLPLEIIERMCDVWKVKSIAIEYEFCPQNAETWSDKGIITPFRFDELYQGTDRESDKKKKKFSSVTISLVHTLHIYGEFINGLIDENDSYSNLIANVRRVFPTDNIIIISQLLPFSFSALTISLFENILKSVWKNPGHLKVIIKHYLFSVRSCIDFDIPKSIYILDRQLKCIVLPEKLTCWKESIGRTFRITDEVGDKTLNFELFFYEKSLKSLAVPVENGVLKHFV